jgi:hypothetical protein
MRDSSWDPDRQEGSVSRGSAQPGPSDSRTDRESVANMDFSDYVFFLEEIERR